MITYILTDDHPILTDDNPIPMKDDKPISMTDDNQPSAPTYVNPISWQMKTL